MRARRATRETHDGTTRVRLPVRSPQSDERRDEIHAVVGLHGFRECLGLYRGTDEPKSIPEPLDRRAGNEDRALERVCGSACRITRDRRENARTALRAAMPVTTEYGMAGNEKRPP